MPYIVRNGIVYSAGGGGSGEEVTKQTVADWGFYELPEGGIPAKDLAEGVIPTIPESLPANGGNADTVDGKHANEFATVTDIDNYKENGYLPKNLIGLDDSIYYPCNISTGMVYSMSKADGAAASDARGISFYDENKNYITDLGVTNFATRTLTYPSGRVTARYVKWSDQPGSQGKIYPVMLEYGEPTHYVPYAASNSDLTASVVMLSEDVDTLAYGETHGGRNLFNEKLVFGRWNNGWTSETEWLRSVDLISVKPNAAYFWACSVSVFIIEFNDNAYLRYQQISGNTSFAVSSTTTKIGFFISTVSNPKIAIIEGTSGSYKPYIKSNATLTEESIRSAELQALGWYVPSEMPLKNSYANGVLTQYVGRVDLGDLHWRLGSVFYADNLSGAKQNSYNGYCVKYTYNTLNSFGSLTNGQFTFNPQYPAVLYIKDVSYTDTSAFSSAVKGVYLYYELSTPITHNLTDLPSQKSMISDAWDSTRTYAVGEYAIYGNTLWKCKVQNVGQLPAENSYWTAVTVGNELGAINRDALELKTVEYTLRRGVEQGSSGAFTAALQVGRMVILNMDLKVNESIDTASTIMTLPKKPTKRVYFTASDRGGQNGFAGFLGDDGTVSFYKAFGAGNYIEGQVVYFTND